MSDLQTQIDELTAKIEDLREASREAVKPYWDQIDELKKQQSALFRQKVYARLGVSEIMADFDQANDRNNEARLELEVAIDTREALWDIAYALSNIERRLAQ
jgi:acetyl-CoA carboxylase alpha subunit